MNNKNRVKATPALFLKVALIGLFLLQVYSYIKADWEFSTGVWSSVTLLYKYAYSNKVMELIRYGLLFLIVFVSFLSVKHNNLSWMYIYALTAFTLVYSAEAILDVGISRALYSGNLPAIYLLVFAFFLGRDQNIWKKIKEIIPFFVIAYMLLLAYEFIDSYSTYGWVIYQNSSMMAYYAHFFALSLVYIYTSITEGKRGLFVCLILLALAVGAVCIRSRAWVIQSIVVSVVVSLTKYRKKNRSIVALMKGIIVIMLIAVVCITVLNVFFGDYVDSLIEKGDYDSRSLQYIELLEQTEPYKWLFGQGMNATYTHRGNSGYAFIDNEIFYLSFHYGIFFTFLYFVPYLMAMIRCFKHRRTMKFWLFASIIIFLWVASVNGLSVFNRIHLDVKSFIMPLFVGHIYQTAKDSTKNGDNDENTIYSR